MDSDSDDDNVHFGTPLEPLEEGSAAKRRPPALEDQTVRDSRGRQRFHGAFTGGFSAGFFNTVGSKDGFQPATFVSSRNTRADRHQARPDDFMDEEDRGEHGIAPQRLQLTAEFRETPTGGIKRKHPQYDEGPIPGEPVLSQLVKPVRDTVGVRILKSMGWRPGQGIGPRVSRKEKKRQRKVYGCARPPGADEPAAAPSDSDSDSDSDSALRELLLAPDDYETPLVKPKHDQMGLGYRGLDRRSVLGPTSADATLRYRDKAGKVAIRGQAFGVGAFEEEDDDIYGTEDMSNYDFESAPERPTARPAPSPADRLARTLAGFRLAESARSTRPRYPPPPLPADFVPRHKARTSRFEPLPEERRGLERHRLSAGQRADMIGEQRQTPTEAVAGTASGAQSVERVTVVAGSTPTATPTPTPAAAATPGTQARSEPSPAAPSVPTSAPPPFSSHPPTTMPIKTEPGIPPPPPGTEESERLREVHRVLAESTDSPAVPALKPFARDPEKQARYEQFLKLSAANRKDDYRLLLPASMTDWEREREISEFHRSALIFRPLAASLASKFVSAGTTEQEKPMEERSGQAGRRHADDPATQAARRKMFGMLTRQTQEWHPAPLLCRRFNVKNPFPHSSVVGTLGPTSGAATSASSSSELVLRPPSPEEHSPPAAPAPKPRLRWDDVMRPDSAAPGAAMGSGATADGGGGSTAPRTTLALPPPSVVGVQPTAAPAQKPLADLFKAIFDDSDTESESEEAAPAERADSPGTPPPPQLAVTASQSDVTRDITPDVKPVVTPAVTNRSTGGVTASAATGDGALRQGTTPAQAGSGGQSSKSGGSTSRPSAASFFEQPPTAAPKRPGFSLFDNVDLDELNSWRRGSGSRGDGDGGGGSGKKLDTSSASAPAGTGVRGDSPSSDEYGPRLPPAGASTSSLSAISRIGRGQNRSDDDSSRWRERSLSKEKKKKKSKKHKKSDKKKKKKRDSVSDSDSSDSDVDMNLFKKLRDVITGKKKKKKSSSKH